MAISRIELTHEEKLKFHNLDHNGNPVSVFDAQIFEYLKKELDIFVMGGIPYVYDHGVYQADRNGAILKTEIRRLILPKFIRSPTIKRIYELFLMDAELQIMPEQLNNFPKHWINFRNGWYDCKKGIMLPHAPTYLAINQIPHEFFPHVQKSGTAIDEWLKFIAPDDSDREMLLEFIGYCMTVDNRQQKFMILRGTGGSGKSTLIRLITEIIGDENSSTISLKQLNQKFASIGLMGKLLNSCADLEVDALDDVSIVKQALGEDKIRGEFKGKDAVDFKTYAKMIFSVNELPLVLQEKTNGFYRRLMVLEMNRTPPKAKTDFLETLEGELDYLIQISVKALSRMYKNGAIHESDHSKEAVQRLRMDSDTVQAWLNERCTLDPEAETERNALYDNYQAYCMTAERQKLSRNSFYRSLRLKNFTEKRDQSSRYFTGISINHR